MKNWRFQFYMELYLYKTPNKNTFEEVDMKIPNYIVGFLFFVFFFLFVFVFCIFDYFSESVSRNLNT